MESKASAPIFGMDGQLLGFTQLGIPDEMKITVDLGNDIANLYLIPSPKFRLESC